MTFYNLFSYTSVIYYICLGKNSKIKKIKKNFRTSLMADLQGPTSASSALGKLHHLEPELCIAIQGTYSLQHFPFDIFPLFSLLPVEYPPQHIPKITATGELNFGDYFYCANFPPPPSLTSSHFLWQTGRPI